MKRRKKTFTLLEIIIAIFLISLITGAIGYSLKGTLEKGRAFRTEQAMEQLHDLLLMCIAEGDTPEDVQKQPELYLRKYGLAKNPSKLLEDGWGEKFKIRLNRGKTDFDIASDALVNYRRNLNPHSPSPEASVEEK